VHTWFSASLNPQCNTGTATVPFVFQLNALASATIPRLAQYPTISFGGLEWYVKQAPVQVYPGPQFFVNSNAYVDAQGQLHMQITPCGGSWCASEIYTTQKVGYGTYTFTVNSELSDLDPNIALGLFSWDAQAGDQNNREWDIEFSRWGNSNASANAQYVIQPYNVPGNIQYFLMSPGAPSTHVVSWTSSQVGFASSTLAINPVNQWTYSAAAGIPTPGDVHLHLNFYIGAGQQPSVPATQEIVISGFRYAPSGPQIGFSQLANNVPFQQQSYAVPLTVAPVASGCAATVESDSPWLSVAGSNVIPAGSPVQYNVSTNIGNSRSGNLILQSTNCNATLGAQVFAVTQAGLVCAPTFATPSTNIGFIQSTFAVSILGTAPVCSWTVNSSAQWLTLTSGASGSGDGSVQVASDANSGQSLRTGVLSLNDGPINSVYQDASGNPIALSPLTVISCSGQPATFGLSWAAPTNVEFHLNSPTGVLVGQFGPTGTTTVPGLADGTLVFMVQSPATSPPNTLASARASVSSSNCNSASIGALGVVNAASYSAASLAPASLATVFGANLSSASAQAPAGGYPTSLAGVTVLLGGQPCPLWYVSPTQINFAVPSSITAPGRYTLMIGSATSDVLIKNVSPGIFTLKGDGTGVPLAAVTGVLANGAIASFPPYQCSPSGCAIAPISLPQGLTDLYIVLYGTGMRNYHNISSTGSFMPEVVYVGAQGQYPGLDQVNLHLSGPFSLSGLQSLQLQVDGALSNAVSLLFQ
jgi:uncharacterized protein (TIGR03437 family)